MISGSLINQPSHAASVTGPLTSSIVDTTVAFVDTFSVQIARLKEK